LIAAFNRCPDGETVPEDQDNIQVRIRLLESPRAAETVGIMGANLCGLLCAKLLVAGRAASGKQ